VSTHDRCGTPIEIAVKKQWFIDVLSHKQELLQAGLDLNWYPKTMRARYINWVENLAWNWCISRQRYFGVPFPVWQCKDCGKVKVADVEDLPVDPLKDMPKTPCSCGSTDFQGETDVMDTWATSSLTPQISLDVYSEKGLSDFMVPMSLRPNAHDNIRVWDFYTIVKSLYHFNKLPWKDLMISGYITSPDGSKLAKSKGNNVHSPQGILKTYSADVTRYWANSLTLGKDTAFSLVEFDNGKRLVNKIWNASKFVLSFLEDYVPQEVALEEMDKWIIEKYKQTYTLFLSHLEKYEISLALASVEKLFWTFCDDYIELVKRRLYNPDVYGREAYESARYASYHVLLGMLKMFSPVLPHITEEIYMNFFADKEDKNSIHISTYLNLGTEFDEQIIENGNYLMQVVSLVRQFKSENKVSLKTFLKSITITSHISDFIKKSEADLKGVNSVHEIIYKEGDFNVEMGEIIPDEITNQN
ncbi:MAG: class I tRNA ligase family protein, partial [Christensenellales bacterium]